MSIRTFAGRIFISIAFTFAAIRVAGQHTVDFTIPAQVCKGEYLAFQNSSEAGTSYQWNFCQPLEGTYTSTPNGAVIPSMASIAIVSDNGLWYGFALDRNNGSELLRINFGDSPTNTHYTVTSLGNPGLLLNGPEWIEMISSNGKWYALVTNQSNDIVRLTWTSLTTAPVAASLNLVSSGKFNNPTQVAIKQDGNNYVAVVANGNTNSLSLINFGSSMESSPSASDVIQSPVFAGSINMYGVTVSRRCDQWEIYTTVSDKVYKVNVGSVLFTPITAGMIADFSADIPITIGSYNRMKSVVIGTDTYVYFSSFTGKYVSAAIWHAGATHAQFKDLTALTVPDQLYSLELFNDNGNYGLYAGSYTNGLLQHIAVTPACSANQPVSTQALPTGIFYSTGGTFPIALTVGYSDGTFCAVQKMIVVNPTTSPDIAISSLNNCAQNNVDFSYQNTSGGISSVLWDFGDASTSASPSPAHPYTNPGTYTAKVTITAANGCQNNASKNVVIYAQPAASFTLPAASPVCTNQDYRIVNTTSYDTASHAQWQWTVNGSAAATTKDLRYRITTAASQTIVLTASIPGCSSQSSQTIATVVSGPSVDFTTANGCEGKAVAFTNASSGSITGYTWDFGDGNTSHATSPQNTFSAIGTYAVTLTVTNPLGCNNTATKLVTIFTTPLVDFSLDLPPFSCNGTPSQFTDVTPNMTDSNLSSWTWDFGDASPGSPLQNPAHTYVQAGDYTVAFSVGTDRGCSATIQRPVTIAATPGVDFTATPACLNQLTTFTDASAAGTKSWVWTIDGNFINSETPTYTFTKSAVYTVQLAATGANGCIGHASKQITVAVPPVLDFTTLNTCAGQPTTFQNATAGNGESIGLITWDFDGQGTAAGSPVTHVFTTTGDPTVTMGATGASGCLYAVAHTITIKASPIASFSASTDAGPAPLDVKFTNTSSGAVSYLWNIDGTTTDAFAPSYLFNTLGSYPVLLTATGSNGCTDIFSETIHVIVPGVDLAIDSSTVGYLPAGAIDVAFRVFNNGNVTIHNPTLVLEIPGEASRSEILPLSLEPGASVHRNLNFSGIPSGTSYACISLTVSGDIDPSNNKICSSFDGAEIIFDPWPNPASGEVHLNWIGVSDSNVNLSVYTLQGQRVVDLASGVSHAGFNELLIDLTGFRPGVYIVRCDYAGMTRKFRIIVN